MTGLPPFDAGADQETATELFAGVPITPVGAPGTVRGVIADDWVDAGPSPLAFRATTVNVYAVPFVRPVIPHVVKPLVAQVRPPGDDVATYVVIALPPSLVGALHDTCAAVFAGEPLTALGAVGRPSVVVAPSQPGTPVGHASPAK